MRKYQNFFLRILNILLPFGLIVLVIYLIIADINLEGERVIVHSARNKSLLVEGPGPEQRIGGVHSDNGDKYWTILIDPVYWQFTLPRSYQEMDVEIIYQAPGVPLVQFGGLASERGWNFYWQGVQNDIFQKIEWPCLVDQDRDWYLCQRQKNYQSIDRFLLGPPRGARILNYNFPLPEGFDNLGVAGYNHEIDIDNFDYLIAKYKEPAIEGSWMKQKFYFHTDSLFVKDDVFQFSLSAPDLSRRDQIIKVKEIKFILKKEPITWDNVVPKLMKNIKKVFGK